MAVNPIRNGFHTVTPYLVVYQADRLISFLQQAFAAKELLRTVEADGIIRHSELAIGDSIVMVGEAGGKFDIDPMSCAIYLYVSDVDAVYEHALQAGATSLMEPTDQYYGDRNACVNDPFGNHWWIATHKHDVPQITGT